MGGGEDRLSVKGKGMRRGALTAVLLSGLVLPGLGQIYLRRVGRGIAMMTGTLVCLGIFLVRVASCVADLLAVRGEQVFSAGEILNTLQTLYHGLSPVASWLLVALALLWVISVADAWLSHPAAEGARGGGRDPGPR